MISDRDVWAMDRMCVNRCGDAAWLEAAKRADDLADKGDYRGSRVWQRVVEACDFLSAERPGGQP